MVDESVVNVCVVNTLAAGDCVCGMCAVWDIMLVVHACSMQF